LRSPVAQQKIRGAIIVEPRRPIACAATVIATMLWCLASITFFVLGIDGGKSKSEQAD